MLEKYAASGLVALSIGLLLFGVWCGLAAASQAVPAASCHYAGPLPDPACTPGAVDPTATQEVVCTRSTRTVRPPVSETNRIKMERLRAYGRPESDMARVELDHLVPLELAGAPDDIRNLWPQDWIRPDGWGAHMKDRLENRLHMLVCSGAVSLT